MGNEWMVWTGVGLFILYAVYRVVALFRRKDESRGSLSSAAQAWSIAWGVSLAALVAGMFLISGVNNNFLTSFYPVRFWCFFIAALLGLIFWLGSAVQRRAAGAAGVLVLGGLEAYSVVSVYPSYGWILKGYAAFCLVLGVASAARRLRKLTGVRPANPS